MPAFDYLSSKNPYAGQLSDEAWSYYRRQRLGQVLKDVGGILNRAGGGRGGAPSSGGGGQDALVRAMRMDQAIEARQDRDAARQDKDAERQREAKQREDYQGLFRPPQGAVPAALAAGGGPTPQAAAQLGRSAPIYGMLPDAKPGQVELLRSLGRDLGLPALAKQAFAKPKAPATATDIGGYRRYLEGPQMGKRTFPEAPPKSPLGMQRTEEGAVENIPGYVAAQKDLAEVKREPTAKYSGEVFMDERVGKYYQINPKTNKKEFISPNEEFMIESTPGGGFSIRKGPTTAAGLTKATTTDIEKQLLGANEGYVRLQNIAASFKPEYQELGTRWDNLVTSWKAKLGGAGAVSLEDKKSLTEYAAFRRDAFSNMNLYIKNITGAQMSEAEAKRLTKAIPDPGDTLLGGDDPITFKAKLESAMRELGKAKVRYAYYLKKGIVNVDEIAQQTPLDTMQVAVNPETGQRIVKIEGQWLEM